MASNERADDLTVVMPVYNEQECIEAVVRKWVKELGSMGMPFKIMALDDGSRDSTPRILDDLAREIPQLEVVHKTNSGHGPTVRMGYARARSEWVLQIDSDDEIPPMEFRKLWALREGADFVIGQRVNRQAPIMRQTITRLESLIMLVLFGGRVHDVNIPFRLVRREALARLLPLIHADAFAPNVLITALAHRIRLRVREVQVVHLGRNTGEVSIKKWKLLKACMKAFRDLVAVCFRMRVGPKIRPDAPA